MCAAHSGSRSEHEQLVGILLALAPASGRMGRDFAKIDTIRSSSVLAEIGMVK